MSNAELEDRALFLTNGVFAGFQSWHGICENYGRKHYREPGNRCSPREMLIPDSSKDEKTKQEN